LRHRGPPPFNPRGAPRHRFASTAQAGPALPNSLGRARDGSTGFLTGRRARFAIRPGSQGTGAGKEVVKTMLLDVGSGGGGDGIMRLPWQALGRGVGPTVGCSAWEAGQASRRNRPIRPIQTRRITT
jgi:hypothetical protein